MVDRAADDQATVDEPVTAPNSTSTDDVVGEAMRGLFGRDSVYLVLWLLQVIGAAAVTPLVTRQLGAGEFGGVATANAVMQVLYIMAGCGLQMAIQRYFADRDGKSSAAGLLTLSLCIAAALGWVADLTGPLWSAALGFEDYSTTVRLAVLWAVLSAMSGSSLALLRSQDKLLAFASVSLLHSVVAAGLSLALVITVVPTAEVFVLGQVVAEALSVLLGLACAPPRLLRIRDARLVRGGLVFGLPLVPALLGGFTLSVADRLVIQAQLGQVEVGRYQVAYNIGSFPTLILGALLSAWMPRLFAVKDDAHRGAVLAASRNATYRLVAPVMIGLSAVSPILLRVWAPPEFRPDDLVLITALIIVSALPYTAATAANRALLTQSRTVMIAVSTVVAAAVNVGLNLVMIPVWGIEGAAVATILAYGVQHALLAISARTRGSAVALWQPAWLQGAAGAAGTLLVVLAPADRFGLGVRMGLALICLVWFGWTMLSISSVSRQRPWRRGG